MVFSLSEDHFAPGKLQLGRETRRQRGEICSCKHFALQTELYHSNQQQMFLCTAGTCAKQTCLSKRWRHFFTSINISHWCKQKNPNRHLLEGLKLRENVWTNMVLMRLFGIYFSFLKSFEGLKGWSQQQFGGTSPQEQSSNRRIFLSNVPKQRPPSIPRCLLVVPQQITPHKH